MKNHDVQADVAQAIKRQEYGGGRESLFDILQATAKNSHEYWSEAACELHRHEKFYESLDCWREAEKHQAANSKLNQYWYNDYIDTLINAAYQTGDRYFIEQALHASERITSKFPNEDLLNTKLELLQIVKPSKETALELIEKILDFGFTVRAKIYLEKLGLKGCLYEPNQIRSYSDLAEIYMWNNELSEAFRIWSKDFKESNKHARDNIVSAIEMINQYADENGYKRPDDLDEEF